MSECQVCGEEFVPGPAILAAGGWCAPSRTYALPEPIIQCDDCRARMIMITEIGIDPGPKGENLRVARGGITYERSEDGTE